MNSVHVRAMQDAYVTRGEEVLRGNAYDDVNEMFTDQRTGAKLFVGNLEAARQKKILHEHKISVVINCQDAKSLNFHESDGSFSYFRLDIGTYSARQRGDSDAKFIAFFQRYFNFVRQQLEAGRSILVHCLAGAHRAGTAGIIASAHFKGISAMEAKAHAKHRRPIIDPIMSLGEMLDRYEQLRLGGRFQNHGLKIQ